MDKYLLEGIDSYIFQDKKIKNRDILVGKFNEKKVLEVLKKIKNERNITKKNKVANQDRTLGLQDLNNEKICREYQRGDKDLWLY